MGALRPLGCSASEQKALMTACWHLCLKRWFDTLTNREIPDQVGNDGSYFDRFGIPLSSF